MAEIHVERKEASMWPWIVGLLLLLLLAWGVYEMLDNDVEEPVAAAVVPPPPVTPTTTPEPIAQGPLCVAQVLAAPTTYIGQRLGTCEMRVAEVVSDRGFWIEENGQRVFVTVNESAPGAPAGAADVQGQQAEQPNINAGQTIRLTEAMVVDNVANVAGNLEPQARNIAQQQPWFLVTDGRNIAMQ